MTSASLPSSEPADSPASGLSRPIGVHRRPGVGEEGRAAADEREVVRAADHLAVVELVADEHLETFASTMWLARSFAMRNMSASPPACGATTATSVKRIRARTSENLARTMPEAMTSSAQWRNPSTRAERRLAERARRERRPGHRPAPRAPPARAGRSAAPSGSRAARRSRASPRSAWVAK